MNWLINALIKLGLLKDDLDYHLVRATMVVLFLFFGYQKWFDYEAQALIPYISNGPLISWMASADPIRRSADRPTDRREHRRQRLPVLERRADERPAGPRRAVEIRLARARARGVPRWL